MRSQKSSHKFLNHPMKLIINPRSPERRSLQMITIHLMKKDHRYIHTSLSKKQIKCHRLSLPMPVFITIEESWLLLKVWVREEAIEVVQTLLFWEERSIKPSLRAIWWKPPISISSLTRKVTYMRIDSMLKPVSTKLNSTKIRLTMILEWLINQMRCAESIMEANIRKIQALILKNLLLITSLIDHIKMDLSIIWRKMLQFRLMSR